MGRIQQNSQYTWSHQVYYCNQLIITNCRKGNRDKSDPAPKEDALGAPWRWLERRINAPGLGEGRGVAGKTQWEVGHSLFQQELGEGTERSWQVSLGFCLLSQMGCDSEEALQTSVIIVLSGFRRCVGVRHGTETRASWGNPCPGPDGRCRGPEVWWTAEGGQLTGS